MKYRYDYISWFLRPRGKGANGILREAVPKGTDTPEGFYHNEVKGDRSNMYDRAVAHGIPFKLNTSEGEG